MAAFDRFLPLLGRILMCLIFLLSGFGKLADPAGTIGYIGHAGLPLPTVSYAIALIVEIGFAAMLLVGFQARLAGLVLAVFCVVTALGFHSNFADQMQMINFMKNLAMAGGFLYVASFGAGPFSLDARRGATRDAATATARA